MATSPASELTVPQPRNDLFAALLSYLVPGLGQIYQGRFGKGLMFLVCLLGMFFYGMYLGDWKNVYLPTDLAARTGFMSNLPGPLANAVNRLPFVGQFWIGTAAWPAVMQYHGKQLTADQNSPLWDFQKTPPEEELIRLQTTSTKGKIWDLGLVYTVVAGVLNILVIYDALAGPALLSATEEVAPKPNPLETVA